MPKKNRNRKTYDLPPEVTQMIADIAHEYGISESQLAAYILAEGLLNLNLSKLERRLRKSASLYYRSNVDIDDLLDKME